jgi:hypothetical protein
LRHKVQANPRSEVAWSRRSDILQESFLFRVSNLNIFTTGSYSRGPASPLFWQFKL